GNPARGGQFLGLLRPTLIMRHRRPHSIISISISVGAAIGHHIPITVTAPTDRALILRMRSRHLTTVMSDQMRKMRNIMRKSFDSNNIHPHRHITHTSRHHPRRTLRRRIRRGIRPLRDLRISHLTPMRSAGPLTPTVTIGQPTRLVVTESVLRPRGLPRMPIPLERPRRP
ncbi:hypothetical protein ACPXB3_22505, partial [Gordonia sp. DT219]|uniref:hypothetical protein n=1 Tax=Gordonia sp. DT219 TaxID=3416658 RepID=UPI003CF03CB9